MKKLIVIGLGMGMAATSVTAQLFTGAQDSAILNFAVVAIIGIGIISAVKSMLKGK